MWWLSWHVQQSATRSLDATEAPRCAFHRAIGWPVYGTELTGSGPQRDFVCADDDRVILGRGVRGRAAPAMRPALEDF